MGRSMILLFIYSGCILMIFNIVSYLRFYRYLRSLGGMERTGGLLSLPIFLLILFLIGYFLVALIGDPDIITAGILFGGSIFVFAILRFMQRITAFIQHQEQLKSELSAARQASEAKTVFLSSMSHDIRTPLNAIIGYTELAKRPSLTLPEAKNYLSKIEGSGTQLLALINDLLEMRRIESGRTTLDETPSDLLDIVSQSYDMFAPQMAAKQLRFSLHTETVINRFVLADSTALGRILLNLLSNALKFTPEGGEVSLSLIQTDPGKDQGENGTADYELRVRDTGIGMSPEFAAKIFDPFERERSSTVSGIQGTGLGMAITKFLVDLMKGTIEVDSTPGLGTEFRVRLSFGVCSDEELTDLREEKKAQAGDTDLRGKRILLTEDVEINREIASMMLEELGLLVETANNGREAVDKLSSGPAGYFDAVLMDIQMPVMNGYEAARAIRSLPDPVLSSIPIIALTADAFREDQQKAADAGMNDHIAKPIEVSRLREALHRSLCS